MKHMDILAFNKKLLPPMLAGDDRHKNVSVSLIWIESWIHSLQGMIEVNSLHLTLSPHPKKGTNCIMCNKLHSLIGQKRQSAF